VRYIHPKSSLTNTEKASQNERKKRGLNLYKKNRSDGGQFEEDREQKNLKAS
jgi:hypothetical protein